VQLGSTPHKKSTFVWKWSIPDQIDRVRALPGKVSPTYSKKLVSLAVRSSVWIATMSSSAMTAWKARTRDQPEIVEIFDHAVVIADTNLFIPLALKSFGLLICDYFRFGWFLGSYSNRRAVWNCFLFRIIRANSVQHTSSQSMSRHPLSDISDSWNLFRWQLKFSHRYTAVRLAHVCDRHRHPIRDCQWDSADVLTVFFFDGIETCVIIYRVDPKI